MTKKESTKDKKNKKIANHDPEKYISTEPEIAEAKKGTVVVAWGRMNPITTGHEKLVKKVISVAKTEKAIPLIFLTHSEDPKKNPLSYEDKLKFAQKAFGSIVQKSNARVIFEMMKQLQKQFNRVILVAGSDRVKEFNSTLNRYNGKEYNFDEIKVVSAGQRDADADNVSGISGTKMRGFAADKNIKKFTEALPKNLKPDAEEVMAAVRKGMKLSEEIELEEKAPLTIAQRRKRGLIMKRFRTKIKAAKNRAKRRLASKDKLLKRSRKRALEFMRNRLMKNKKYSQMSPAEKIALDRRMQKISPAVIDRIAKRMFPKVRAAEKERLKSVLSGQAAKNEDLNISFEMFLESRSTKPQDPDIKDMPGSQPKGYYKGVDKDKKDDRARHFAKYAKMDDDDPKAYKPAPGDKEAETKPSVHTKKFKQMFGEEWVCGKCNSEPCCCSEINEASYADTKVRKRPHMALEKNGAPKFDKRFKIFRDKETVTENKNDEKVEIEDLCIALEEFLLSEDFDILNESNPEKSLKDKAEKTGISYGILKKVFDRGVAAWRTGHRPGTTPTQWGLARVNSFATKGKGTWGKADADLAAKVRKEGKEDPIKRERGTDSLTNIYKGDTPGQEKGKNK